MLETRKDAAKKKLQISDQHDSLRARIRNFRSQMVWAQVEEQERVSAISPHFQLVLSKQASDQASLTEEMAKADELIINAESELARFDDAFQAVENRA